MAGDDIQSPTRMPHPSAYQEALDALSSLITRRVRADGSNRGDQFDLLFAYLKILELENSISEMKVIHVAGTKGKGSTCAFTESILRNCGMRTGLFTSPHLIDVRERFRINGLDVSEEKFLDSFWWCWHKLQENTNNDIPMPAYFRFLTLLGFKIFSSEKVDVVILEVGLGGKFDATNVVQRPIVCGVSSLGYDHMEILGSTLAEIAGEKAGIFKRGVDTFTVPQPEEAMLVLRNYAIQLNIQLHVVEPLDCSCLNGHQLGLHGDHQRLNAALAVAISRAWLQKMGHFNHPNKLTQWYLLEEFIKGLTTASLQGRAQIVHDPYFRNDESCKTGGVVFFLDGAHSPESMEACANWFSQSIKEDISQWELAERSIDLQSTRYGVPSIDETNKLEYFSRNSKQILLFNCMSIRDPQNLFPPLINACSSHGISFHKALFVPNQSMCDKVGSHALPVGDAHVDLSWQYALKKTWDRLRCYDKGNESSSVFSSLPLAISWLRECAESNQCTRFQVLVAGSLHLVGDVLRLVKR